MVKLAYKEPERLKRMEVKMKALASKYGLGFDFRSYDDGSAYFFHTKTLLSFLGFDTNVVRIIGWLNGNSYITVFERGYEQVANEAEKILSRQ